MSVIGIPALVLTAVVLVGPVVPLLTAIVLVGLVLAYALIRAAYNRRH